MMNWKGYESVCSTIKLLSQYLPGRTIGKKNPHIRITGLSAKIWSNMPGSWDTSNFNINKLNSSYYVGLFYLSFVHTNTHTHAHIYQTHLWPIVADSISKDLSIVIKAATCDWLLHGLWRFKFGAGILVPETETSIWSNSCQCSMNRMKSYIIHL
jgi:hypothetical protein